MTPTAINRRTLLADTTPLQAAGQLLLRLSLSACCMAFLGAAAWTPQQLKSTPGGHSLEVWFDGADASTLTMNPSNPAQLIGWQDKSGMGHNAVADPSSPPSLGSLNGLTTVDFGPFAYGYSGYPHLFVPRAYLQTVVILWGSVNGGSFMLGNTDRYDFHRAYSGGGSASEPIFEIASNYSNAPLRTGDANTRMNGTLIDPTQTGLSGDWDIVATRVTTGSTETFDALAYDRGIRSGGQGIAELVVLPYRASDADIQRVEGYLAWKWGLQGKLPAGHPYKGQAPQADPNQFASALLGEYHFEEASWNGTAGEVLDASGNGHHGTSVGSPLAAPMGGAPAIPGNPGTRGFAGLPGPSHLGGAIDLPGFALSTDAGVKTSVSFWMYWTGAADGMALGWAENDLMFYQGTFGFDSNNGGIYGVDSSGLANGWHHVAAIFTNNNVASDQLYIDGVLQTMTQRGVSLNDGVSVVASTLRVGGTTTNYGDGYRFIGKIDEVRVYSGSLTAAEVASAMAATHSCGAGATAGRFNAFESATSAGAVTGPIHTKVAATAFTVDVVSLTADGSAMLTNFAGDVKVEWLDASDNSGTLDAGGCRSTWSLIPGNAGATLGLTIGDGGRKSVSLVEPDVWRDVRVRLSTPATGSPTTVACSTDDFANRPAALSGFAASDADSKTAGATRTLANTSASGGNVHKAGQPFTLHAAAVNSSGTTTGHYAGTPSIALSNCSGSACVASATSWTFIAGEGSPFSLVGTRTVRYGDGSHWATLVLTGGGLCDNSVFGDPSTGVGKYCQVASLGSLSVTPTAVAGVIDRSATYDEAGSFALQLTDSSFASVDAADGSSAAEMTFTSPLITVGRFVPDHFDVTALTAPVLRTFDSSLCAARSFTYAGQPFGYASVGQARVTARNAGGTTTTFYNGALWKLDASSIFQSFAVLPANPTLDTSAATVPALTNNGDGTSTLAVALTDKLRFNRPSATPIGPFNANIALSWSVTDGTEAGVGGNGSIGTPAPLTFSNLAFDAGREIRFGVLRLAPAYGSELIDLPVAFEAQYWDGQRMAINTADQCTVIPANAVAMSNYQRNLSACKTAIGTGSLTLANGRAYGKLAKPGSGNSGSVDLALQLGATASGQTCSSSMPSSTPSAATVPANLPWLQGKWSGAAAFDQNPSTRASFGQYRSPLIYQREAF